MRGWGRGQADLDGIEMVDVLSPNAPQRRVTPMALISNDQVERVNRNIHPVSIVFDVRVATRLREAALSAE